MKRFFQNVKLSYFLAILAVLGSALCFSGCGDKSETLKVDELMLPTVLVNTQTIQRKSQPISEKVLGTVRAKRQATLEAKVIGRIEQLTVVLGLPVKVGQRVAHLEAAEINARLVQAEALLEQADRDWKRISTLYEQKAVTPADVEAAQARHRVAVGAAAEAKAMMSYLEIVAPFDGVVTHKWANVGDIAAPGKPLISMEDPSTLQLEADVPQGIASNLQQGGRLITRVDGINRELTGTVSEISPVADPITRTIQIKVDLSVQPGLRAGQFGWLMVPIGEDNILCVPNSSVHQRGQLQMVFVVAEQHAQMHLVRSGKQIGDEIEILSGLESGDVVVTDGAAQLIDGQAVKIK